MLNDNIKIIRKNKGYSQEELASKLHVTRQTISKWENGQSEPSATMLKDMAKIFEVPVSELLDGNADRIIENKVIIDQLSKVNEHLVIAQKRSGRRTRIVACVFTIIVLIIVLIIMHEKLEIGQHIQGMEHIGELTYFLPDDNYYHAKNDIGITIRKDGSEQITAKVYKNYKDLSKITIWSYDKFDQRIIDDFKSDYTSQIKEYTEDNGTLPKHIEFFIAATDGGYNGTTEAYVRSSFYKAFFLLEGNFYSITVDGGDDPLSLGQMVVSTLAIDKSLKEEYIK